MIDVKKTGLSLGIVVGILYMLRSLVFVLFGQQVIGWVGRVHMIKLPVTLMLSWSGFILGLTVHLIIAFVLGALFAAIWNVVNKN